jgi:hypothetical protein
MAYEFGLGEGVEEKACRHWGLDMGPEAEMGKVDRVVQLKQIYPAAKGTVSRELCSRLVKWLKRG